MKRFEDRLREALRPEEPSPDFTARVMARLNAEPAPAPVPRAGKWRRLIEDFLAWPVGKVGKWALAGAMATALLFAGVGFHQYREEREHQRLMAEIAEGEKAKEQVILAMKIASDKLNYAQKKVREKE